MKTKWSISRLLIACLMLMVGLAFAGCAAAPPKPFDPNISGPQMIVHPEALTLGVATLANTPIVFKGKGFQPGDSVFISLLDVEKDGAKVDAPIADAEVDQEGNFTATVGTLARVTELVRGSLGTGKDMENIIVVTGPTIPAGVYTAKAISMEGDASADCQLTLLEPTFGDTFKDWMGRGMGKIERKR